MSGKAVRRSFMREFRGMSPNKRATSAIIVAFYVLQTLASIALGYWLLQSQMTFLTGTGLAALALFTGTRLRGFNNIVHECSHFTFCEHREDNVLYGSICASLILGCFRDYRDEHMTHHAHLGDYDHDRDLQGVRDLRLEDPLTLSTIARHLLTIICGRHLPYYLNINLSARDGKIYAAMKVAVITLSFALLLLDPIAAILLVWLPFVWVFTAMNYLTDCVDHGGLIHADDELEASRNLPIPKQLSAILFPRNDCYHLVHHLFPQVPAHHLAACHERLMTHPDYRARMDIPTFGRAIRSGMGGKEVRNGWGLVGWRFARE